MDEITTEHTPLVQGKGKKDTNIDYDDTDNSDADYDIDGSDYFDVFSGSGADSARQESIAADRLSIRLLAIDDDDDVMEDLILHETLNITLLEKSDKRLHQTSKAPTTDEKIVAKSDHWTVVEGKLFSMTSLCVLAFGLIAASFWIGAEFIGPPNQPVGPYSLVERHVCIIFLLNVAVIYLLF
jgi:hypothetical protein